MNEPQIDPELADLSQSLDALARADRDSAPPGFEERIAASTLPAAPAPIPFTAPVAQRAAAPTTAWRLAAAAALAATVGAVMLARVRTTPTTSPDPRIAASDTLETTLAEEELLFALAGWDDDNGGLSELRAAAESLSNSIRAPWSAADLGAFSGDTTGEGAMQ